MREIRFRVWDNQIKEISDPFGLSADGKAFIGRCFLDFPSDVKRQCWIKDIEIMQYTGLKDRNGKEIYEGDIVKHRWSAGGDWQITHIAWIPGGFTYASTRYDYDGLLYPEEWEVIGNIHENSELIKQGEEGLKND